MPDLTETGSTYSSGVGLVFIFNIIVGTGALAMPKAFYSAGWLVSAILLVVLGIISFITVTYIIEAMAAANAMIKLRKSKENRQDAGQNSVSENATENTESNETDPLLGSLNASSSAVMSSYTEFSEENIFEITQRVEMGQMASMFFNNLGRYIFYISIIIYLYGDMTIYTTAVSKSIRNVACTYKINQTNSNETLTDEDLCWPGSNLSRQAVLRIIVGCFTALFGPLVFFNAQKTALLQVITTVTRWLAFVLMITLAIIRLASGNGTGNPGIAHLSGVPVLFGTCVYSFMCHHSLPSIVTPIRRKSSIRRLFAMDFLLILAFYALLSFTGIFAFDSICDLYTLNFLPNTAECNYEKVPITDNLVFQYFLALFPAFTLTTSYPVLGITLRNNIKTLTYAIKPNIPYLVDRLIFPLLVILPPLAISLFFQDISLLVGITGSYGGVVIQYMVPAALVLCTRRATRAVYGNIKRNHHRSPFAHTATVIVILVWSVICMIFSTINFALKRD